MIPFDCYVWDFKQAIYINDFFSYIVRCDYEAREYYHVSIPVNVTTFKYNFTIFDDDVYEKLSEMVTVVIDFSSHDQIIIDNPYTASVIIKDDEERKLYNT